MKLTPVSREAATIFSLLRCFLLMLAASAGLAVAADPAPAARHEIQVVLRADSGEINIHDRVLVSQLESYRFQLAPWLVIEAVQLNGQPADPVSTAQGYVVELGAGEQHVLEFRLAGQLPAPAMSGASHHAGSIYGTDGSYLPGYDAWIPHDPGQALRFRLRVEVPTEWRAIATGKLVDESVTSSDYRVTIEQDRPGEAPTLFAGPYRVHERDDNGRRLRTYFHPGLEDYSEGYLDASSRYIEAYQQEIGGYPYVDFHVVSAPLPVGLGFPGLTYIDRRIVPLPFMRTRSLAHEVLHNWWGNAVAVDYAAGNWAEGLTTFMADYALEVQKGDEAAQAMRIRWLRDYAALPAERDMAVRDFRSKRHQADQVIGYNKVAFIFHMLRREIGQQAFAEGIRRFWREQRFARASWQDLQGAFELAAARDLDWFFAQWLERSGAPRLSLGTHQVTKLDAGYLTRIELLQPEAGYRFQLPVLLQTAAGSERREITVAANRTVVEWLTPAPPQFIRFDPDSDVFRRLRRDETPPILRDISLDPRAQVLLVSQEGGFLSQARSLAQRLFDAAPEFLPSVKERDPRRPLLLITGSGEVEAQLAILGIRAPAELPDLDYQGAAWTARMANGTPVLVVSADSTEDLQSMLRPLPHYGGQSYILFDQGRAVSRGIWPLSRGSLFRDLQAAD